MNNSQISSSEFEIMRVIWDMGGKAYFSEIAERLEAAGFSWKNNTILTFLSRLVEKKILSINKVGRKNEYFALVDEHEYAADQTVSFVGRVYEGDVKGLVSTLIQQDLISVDDLDELKNFWKGTKKD